MFRGAVFGLLVAIPVFAQFRTRVMDPSGQSSIASGRVAPGGDIIVGGGSTNGELTLVNSFQSKYASSGLMRTRDGGRTWSMGQRPLRTNFRLMADPVYAETVYALDASGLFRSNDAGETWSKLSDDRAVDLQVDRHAPATLYLLSFTDLVTSTDSGESWTRRALPNAPTPTGFSSPFSQLALDPFHEGVLYMGGYGGLHRTTDAGATWSQVPFPEAPLSYSSVLFDPNKDGMVYRAGPRSGGGSTWWRSSDGMSSWKELNGPESAIALDPVNSGTLFSSARGGAMMSTDYGDTWRTLPAAALGGQIFLIPGTPSTVIYAMSTSLDGGQTWRGPFSFTLTNAAGSAVAPGLGYAVVSPESDAFVARLDAMGEEIRFSTLLGGSKNDYVIDVAVDDEGNTYAAAYTTSPDFPTTDGAAQRELTVPLYLSGFVAKFDPAGTLLWSTMTPGAVLSVAVDHDQSVVFFTGILGRITPDGARIDLFGQDALREDVSAFSGPYFTKMALTPQGEVIVAGERTRPSGNNLGQMMIVRVATDGELISKVRLDARGSVQALAVDAEGNAVIAGIVASDGLPTTPGALLSSAQNTRMPFVLRLSREGEVVSSTFFGGAGDYPNALLLAANGDAVVSGSVNVPGSFQAVNPVVIPQEEYSADGRRNYITRISADGTALRYAFLTPEWALKALPADDQAICGARGGLVFLNLPAAP